jgi:ribosomal protein L17
MTLKQIYVLDALFERIWCRRGDKFASRAMLHQLVDSMLAEEALETQKQTLAEFRRMVEKSVNEGDEHEVA